MSISDERFRGEPGGGGRGGPKSFQLPERPAFSRLITSIIWTIYIFENISSYGENSNGTYTEELKLRLLSTFLV